jgi:arylformamidase
VKIVDITISLNNSIPSWPESKGFSLSWPKRLENGDICNNSYLTIDTHTGTHLDAPFHFFSKGATIEQVYLEKLIGPCTVCCLSGVKDITPADLAQLNLSPDTSRLLLQTDNSRLQLTKTNEFKEVFTALSPAGAHWIVDNGIDLVGIDYLSIGGYHNGVDTHKILLNAEVVVVEGLDLEGVEPGKYELICLPLKITGAEGAPARAVLRKI